MKRIAPITEALPSQLMDLTNLLNFDDRLMEDIGMKPGEPISVPEFVAFNAQWVKKRGAEIFMILNDHGEAVGMITLVFKTEENNARCGYFLGSAHRGRGFGKEAFSELLAVARSRDCQVIEATIAKDNEISQKIWRAYGAEFLDSGENYSVMLSLEGRDPEE